MNTDDYWFSLPEHLIAQSPAPIRSDSRLMVLNKTTGAIEHGHFFDLPRLLCGGDLLIANNSRVIPARLIGVKEATGAVIELLLLRPLAAPGVWEALLRPAKRVKLGQRIVFGEGELRAVVTDAGEDGLRVVEFSASGEVFDALLETLGRVPLPPYITERLGDPERYQTVYAKERGSVAAPTAGLHFTPELLDRLRAGGVDIQYITLHIGLGTFRPVQSERVEEHRMHAEWYTVPKETLIAAEETKARGGRVICVGTTAVRALESAWLLQNGTDSYGGSVQSAGGDYSGHTDLFIVPGFPFRVTDALITNFHLPRSTLLMLVSALVGRERLLRAYETAVAQGYRFYSFGDAMLIV
ncbi:MAG: tRNA preQ1(34) S-adenosylmethionine ribosyltransferase-isomerase QueA [Bacilli bacterium]